MTDQRSAQKKSDKIRSGCVYAQTGDWLDQFMLESKKGYEWLRDPSKQTFNVEYFGVNFTARKEYRGESPKMYLYGFKKINGKTKKIYIGALDEIKESDLIQTCQKFESLLG